MNRYASTRTPDVAEASVGVVATIAPRPVSPATDRMRRVNELISESLARGRNQSTALFCECADPDCFGVVWLSPTDYQEARRDPSWVAISREHADLRLAHPRP